MRGFPPIQIFLLCLAFAVLAIPLAHLTGSHQLSRGMASGQPPVAKKEAQLRSVWLRLRYAHRPATLSLKVADKELLTAVEDSPIEVKTTLPDVSAGLDAFLSATWAEGTPDTALTLEVEPDGLDTRSETRWSSAASLNEVLSFSWK